MHRVWCDTPPFPSFSQACLLHAESLSGDNQYRCDFCAAKVDALRRVRLRSLPPYLCLALQRFYFNPNVSSSRQQQQQPRPYTTPKTAFILPAPSQDQW